MEEPQGVRVAFLRPPVPVVEAVKVQIVSGKVAGRAVPRAVDLGFLELRRDRPDHPGDDLVLQLENIRYAAVEPVGPEMMAGPGVDQLPRDPHAAARLAHAPFEHVTHAQLPPDL